MGREDHEDAGDDREVERNQEVEMGVNTSEEWEGSKESIRDGKKSMSKKVNKRRSQMAESKSKYFVLLCS